MLLWWCCIIRQLSTLYSNKEMQDLFFVWRVEWRCRNSLLVPIEKNLFGCLVDIRYATFFQLASAYGKQIEKLHNVAEKVDFVMDHQLEHEKTTTKQNDQTITKPGRNLKNGKHLAHIVSFDFFYNQIAWCDWVFQLFNLKNNFIYAHVMYHVTRNFYRKKPWDSKWIGTPKS